MAHSRCHCRVAPAWGRTATSARAVRRRPATRIGALSKPILDIHRRFRPAAKLQVTAMTARVRLGHGICTRASGSDVVGRRRSTSGDLAGHEHWRVRCFRGVHEKPLSGSTRDGSACVSAAGEHRSAASTGSAIPAAVASANAARHRSAGPGDRTGCPARACVRASRPPLHGTPQITFRLAPQAGRSGKACQGHESPSALAGMAAAAIFARPFQAARRP